MKHILCFIIAIVMTTAANAAENLTVAGNNLRGPVKTYSVYMAGLAAGICEFDRQGRLIKETDSEKIATYTWHDNNTFDVVVTDLAGNKTGAGTYAWKEEGNMFIIAMGDNGVAHYLDENGRQLMKLVMVGDRKVNYYYHYDADGNVVGSTIKCDGQPDVEAKIINENIDSYGNARKQTVVMNGQEYPALCKYTYYE